jgi:hypothetical protein
MTNKEKSNSGSSEFSSSSRPAASVKFETEKNGGGNGGNGRYGGYGNPLEIVDEE